MNNYQVSLKKLVAFASALILVSVSSPLGCFAADDDGLPGLKVLRAPIDAASPSSADDGLLRKTSPTSSARPTRTTAVSAEAIEKDAAQTYRLGPGDVLSITDYGMRDDSDFPTQTVTVLPDGTVNVYPAGLMKVSGLTVKQFNDQLIEKAKEFVIEPQYVVNIVQSRPISVYVLGEVANPGLYSFGAGGDSGPPGMEGPMSSMGRLGMHMSGQTGKPKKMSPQAKDTMSMLGAVYGAKFVQWAPKWGAVGGLAAYGMKQQNQANANSSSPMPFSNITQPFTPPGSGSPARNLNSFSGGYNSMQGNYGSLAFSDVGGGVNPAVLGVMAPGGAGPTGGFAGNMGRGGYFGGPGGGMPTGQAYSASPNLVIPAQASVNVNNVTVMTAIERAGGLRDTANVRRIQVRRADSKEVINVDVWKLVSEGDVSQDVIMQPNDTIFIPQGGSDFNPDSLGALAAYKGRWVRVLGSVRAPGLVELRPNDDIYSVIARAGGFANFAVQRSVLLSRMNRDGTVFSKRISLAKGMKDREALARLPVQSGDVIIASTSMIKSVGSEVLRAGMITGLAMLIIYFSNKVTNVNVQTNDEGVPTNNARVAVF
jgi:polysaccharide biosynthesis/export protein